MVTKRTLSFFIFFFSTIVFASFKIDNNGNYTILGYAQFIYQLDLTNKMNEFNNGTSSLSINGKITRKIGFRIETEPNPNNFRILDFYSNLKFDSIEIRVGQFTTPIVEENILYPPNRYFINYTLLGSLLSPWDIGIHIISKTEHLDFNFAVVNGEGVNGIEKNKYKDLIFRLMGKYNHFEFGGAIYHGKSGKDNELMNKRLFVTTFKYYTDQFYLRSEYMNFEKDGYKGKFHYIQGGYKLKLGNECLKEIEPVLRYDLKVPNIKIKDDYQKRLTFGINFYLKGHQLKLQLNYVKDIFVSEVDIRKDTLAILFQYMF